MLLSRLAKRYRRWRHTRGFGIHSPYAYALLTDSLRPGTRYGYYGDSEISDAVEEWRMETGASGRATHRLEHRCRLLLRLIAGTHPATLWLDPQLPAPLIKAAEVAGYRPGEKLVTDRRKCVMAVLVASDGRQVSAEMFRHLTVPGHSMLVLMSVRRLPMRFTPCFPRG